MDISRLFHPLILYASEFPEVDDAFRLLERKLARLEIPPSLCEELRTIRDRIEDSMVERVSLLSEQGRKAG